MEEQSLHKKSFYECYPNVLAKLKENPNLITDMHIKTVKKPVALLQEICTKLVTEPPVYEIIETAGPPHEPIFVYQIKNYSKFCDKTGNGTSKANAKHAVALELLQFLKEVTINTKFNADLDELM